MPNIKQLFKSGRWLLPAIGIWLVWWVAPAQPLGVVRIPSRPSVPQYSITHDGRVIYHDRAAHLIRVIDIRSGRSTAIPSPADCEFMVSPFPPYWIKTLTRECVTIVDSHSGRELLSIPRHGSDQTGPRHTSADIRFDAPAAGRVALFRYDDVAGASIDVWDIPRKSIVSTVCGVRFPGFLDPQGRWVVSAVHNSEDLAVYDADTGAEQFRHAGPPNGQLDSLELLDDGRPFAAWRLPHDFWHLAVIDPTRSRDQVEWQFSELPWKTVSLGRQSGGGRWATMRIKGHAIVKSLDSDAPPFVLEKHDDLVFDNDKRPIIFGSRKTDGRNGIQVTINLRDHRVPADIPRVMIYDELLARGGNHVVVQDPASRPVWARYPAFLARLWNRIHRDSTRTVYDIRTGKVTHSLPAPRADGAQSRTSSNRINDDYYYFSEETNVTDFVRIEQWPLIAPPPPWWLWAVTVGGIVLTAIQRRWGSRR